MSTSESPASASSPKTSKQTRLRKRFVLSWRTGFWLAVIVLIIVRLNSSFRDSVWSLSAAQPVEEGLFRVVRVIDGDTLIVVPSDVDPELQSARLTIRLLGINAPEATTKVEPFGPEATKRMRAWIDQRVVRLEWDKRRIDRYGRRLAYVYLDDVLLNEALVREGLAKMFTYPGDASTQTKHLGDAQDAARSAKLGIWSVEETITPGSTLPTNADAP